MDLLFLKLYIKKKKAQRKYRATPRGQATEKKSDAAYYQAMKAMKAGARAMRQGDVAKNAEKMAQCLARNDCAGDPCGHRPGLPSMPFC